MRITGEVGAGRTVAVRAVLSTLDTNRHSVNYLPNLAIQAADNTALAFSHEFGVRMRMRLLRSAS